MGLCYLIPNSSAAIFWKQRLTPSLVLAETAYVNIPFVWKKQFRDVISSQQFQVYLRDVISSQQFQVYLCDVMSWQQFQVYLCDVMSLHKFQDCSVSFFTVAGAQWGLENPKHSVFQWLPSVKFFNGFQFSNDILFWPKWWPRSKPMKIQTKLQPCCSNFQWFSFGMARL